MAGRSSCPECGTILRVRDRSYVGRKVSCPECQTALCVVSETDHGDFVVRRLKPEERSSRTDSKPVAPPSEKIPQNSQPTQSLMKRLLESPLTAAWLLAIAISSLVAVMALTPKYRFAKAPAKPPTEGAGQLVDPSPEPEIPPDQQEMASQDTVEVQPPTNLNDLASEPVTALEPVNLDGRIPPPSPPAVMEMTPELNVEATPIPTRIDVETKMKQELVSYKQVKPVSRRDLIEALREHLGASIQYDSKELGDRELDKTITFEVENTTIGDLIKKVADGAGWEIQIEENGIRLTRRQ